MESPALKKMKEKSQDLKSAIADEEKEGQSQAAPQKSHSKARLGKKEARQEYIDSLQIQSDYFDLKKKFDDLAYEHTSLQEEAKRKQDSYLRREGKYKNKIDSLQEQVDQVTLTRQEDSTGMPVLKDLHGKIQGSIASLQSKTTKVLQEQERDLVRAFRSRLSDVQTQLEKERNKKDDGSLEWIEKTRTLSKELDWTKEEALRLDRVNQLLAKENQRLKNQYKTQEDDREFLVRQLVSLKKDNARLTQDLTEAKAQSSTVGSATQAPTTLPRAARNMGRPRTSPEKPTTYKDDNRYKEIIRRLKHLLDVERRNLRLVRSAHANELSQRTELEVFLRQCIEDVKKEINRRRSEMMSKYAKGSQSRDVSLKDFSAADREKVMELLLSQERVISLLYDKTFPPREMSSRQSGVPADDGTDRFDDFVGKYEAHDGGEAGGDLATQRMRELGLDPNFAN